MTRAAVSRLLRTSTHIRLLVLGLVVLAVVGSLFVQAGAVTTGEHLRYARDLREIRQVDAELNTATIASRLDIGSWQAVEAHSARMRTLIDALHDTPSFLTHEERLRVLDQLDSYARMQQHKQQLVAALQEELARITEPAQARHQRLDELSSALLALASARQGEVLVESYAAGYKSAAARTQAHLVLLLAVALGLGVFLLLTAIRLRKTTLAVADTNVELNATVAALRSAEAELTRYATVFTSSSEGMLITDAAGTIIAANPAFSRITGYTLDEVIGHSPGLLNSGRQDAGFYRRMWSAINSRGQWQGEIWNRRRNGSIYPEWLSISAVHGEDGKVLNYIGIFSDITERKEAEARILHLAHHDPLTNLPNRALLQDRLQQVLLQARRHKRGVAVLLLDLDRFKTINDILGHESGDGLLLQITERCRSTIRDTDTLARLSGDEFVIVLQEVDGAHDAALIARKILDEVALPCQLGEHRITVTASIGIALYDQDGGTPSALLRNADAAMHRAKEAGRNGFEFFSAEMNTSSLGQLLLENQLRGAADRGELLLHYQPKECAISGRLLGLEALLRWQHPELGLVAPGRFIPLAEEIGLIGTIGEWVLGEACRQQRAWLDAGLDIVPVAVNLSAQQLAQQNIVSQISNAINDAGLAPEVIELELTETMLMRDIDRNIHTLIRLRDMGVRLSIDDFGTGYSSLNYLRQFPVNALKIDRSFVSDISAEGNEGKIASAIIGMAHSLGLEAIAEGVETEAQRSFLVAQGCHQLQGYLIGRPVPAGELAPRLRPRPGHR
ncbi:EAL domain-containing protein [Thauera mechernichensis]|uniref:EAL domain-containing protein n=1 Tax=Thauera mechernichensis TaxID=82788 RepID=A0ABW3WGE6_9RHOO|nr:MULTISPECIES: EAL domain-containing protein [Betaproteobacteria]ENO92509.1 PAS domain-containing protein/PAC sensor-containing diguanylate cyclase/phosphodiesterase [Thauera sp. 28]MDG3064661.1 EAL domain-containing protein [Thauera mechernichensis]WBL62821.1 EAL domain-containing protein [Thauera sp. WB-2]HNR84834.1 EAL domain-containing protein [Ottowia sp.]HRK10410.1 EAL domain-containing protein [Thauera sp.]